MAYEAVIGLEVHAQLRTRSKLFCGCSTAYGAPPNTHTCPVCLGHPGALPVLNAGAVELALRAVAALECRVRPRSLFARKNYFYPDLPKGYQISQYDEPLAEGGAVRFEVGDGGAPGADASTSEDPDVAPRGFHDSKLPPTWIEQCRRPYIEIVSQPELRTPEEATFTGALRTCFVPEVGRNLERARSLRRHVYVRRRGASPGTRTELKT